MTSHSRQRSAREMPNAPQTTSSIPPLTHGDLERLSPVPQKKTLLSISSPLINLVRRNTVLLSAVVLCMILVGVTAGVLDWSYDRGELGSDDVIPYASGKSGIGLIGHAYHVNVADETVFVIWEIVGCGAYRLVTHPLADDAYQAAGCSDLDRAADIYFDGASTPTFSYDPAKFPLLPRNRTRSVPPLYTFGVKHTIYYFSPDMAPFDTYTVIASAFVIEKATNESVPIVLFAACEGSDGFYVSSGETQMKSTYTYDSGTGSTAVEVESNVIDIIAKRSRFSKAFTICLLLINWALSICSTYVTLVVVIKKKRVEKEVLLLPVTLILTIPTLRSLYAGSPPFGIYIDTFGFFLQMMIVAACSTALVLYTVTAPSVQDRPASRDGGGVEPPVGASDEAEAVKVVDEAEAVKDGQSDLPRWIARG